MVSSKEGFGVSRSPCRVLLQRFRTAKHGEQKTKSGEPALAIWLIVQVVKAAFSPKMKYAASARIIKALAHATRLFILHKLSSAPRSVNELTEMIGADMSTVSRHLSILRNVGILEDEKRGAQVFYRVRVPCVLDVFKCVKAIEDQRDATQKHAMKNDNKLLTYN